MFAPSIQQLAVRDFIAINVKSLNLVARAGCGKTSTLLLLVEFLINCCNDTIFIGAYNKPIAKEIEGKLKALGQAWEQVEGGRWKAPKASASTMHSAGMGAWKKVAPSVVVDDKKTYKIIAKVAEQMPERAEEIEVLTAFTVKAVSLAKQQAFGVLNFLDDKGRWFDMIDHFGLEEDLPEDFDLNVAVKFCIYIYRRSLETCKVTVDYDDMILAPLYFRAKMWGYDYVMIDEAQDTNPARRALAKKMLKPITGRLVAVGDPCQAIYGFTGADAEAMNIIRDEMNSAELPLNVTYRCCKAVVRLAQLWVPDITAAETAPEGIVRTIRLTKPAAEPTALTFWEETLTVDDIILCRNTKPLVEMAYALIRRGTACQVEGREIATGLIKIIRKWRVKGLVALDNALENYRVREVQKWLAKGKEERADRVNDQCETIRVLSEKLQSEGKKDVESLIQFIDSIFGKFNEDPAIKPNILTLCTIHKSKGREWNRVYLLGRTAYQPSKYAKKDWQMEQERNLMYVAVTRAANELVEVTV